MILFIHLLACLWLFFSDWFEDEVFQELLDTKNKGFKTQEELYSYLIDWSWNKYFHNIYFMLVTLSTVGYGDYSVLPAISDWGINKELLNKSDLISVTFMMLLGLSAFNYLTGRLNIKIQ